MSYKLLQKNWNDATNLFYGPSKIQTLKLDKETVHEGKYKLLDNSTLIY